MRKVLIIGAKGMLGQDLVKAFQQNGNYDVFAWDFNDLDITKREEVFDKLKNIKPDILINSAAYNAVDKAEEPEGFETAMAVNALGPKNLAEYCKENNILFVQYSTDYVFRGDKKEGYRENDTPDPVSKYGQSKYEGEKNVQATGGNYYLIRTSKLFGRAGIGQNVKKSFADTMIELSEKLPELKVVDEEWSCFTYTPDLAEATLELISAKMPFGIYHIVNSEPCTWYGYTKTLFEILGKEVKLTPVPASTFPRPAKRPDYSVLLNTKLPPLRSYREALKDFLNKA
jgi:dTDP-4-dehydrorhamnose reductase